MGMAFPQFKTLALGWELTQREPRMNSRFGSHSCAGD